MARMHRWIGLAALSFMLTGCVSAEKYNALKLERDRLAEGQAQAQAEALAARAEADSYKNQLKAIMDGGNNLQALVANLSKENADLKAQAGDLMRKYEEAMNRPIGLGGPLPQEVSTALAELARQYPEIMDFDAARGIVKFKSDVTFALGSADLTSKAREVIAKFASILNSPAVASYEMLVAGHTDNLPVSRAETKAAGHKDNWYLSAHRAISVGGELMAHRVSSQRIGVLGYADQRPVASNSSDAGRAQNRRVEVLILPTTVRGGSTGGAARPAALNKDTAAPAAAPARPLNKDVVPMPENK